MAQNIKFILVSFLIMAMERSTWVILCDKITNSSSSNTINDTNPNERDDYEVEIHDQPDITIFDRSRKSKFIKQKEGKPEMCDMFVVSGGSLSCSNIKNIDFVLVQMVFEKD